MGARKKIAIDPEDFTLGELEQLHKEVGVSLSELSEGTAKALVGMVWLWLRRTNPEATLEDARALHLGDFQVSENPTEKAAS